MLRSSGGYRDTCSFQTATLIYDATYWFCDKYLDARSRTVDQMVQAARSGRQNIAEGGYSEQLAAARLVERNRRKEKKNDPPVQSDRPDRTDPSDHIPNCPLCGKAMALRTAQKGKNAGQQFWGCTAYPECRGVVNV